MCEWDRKAILILGMHRSGTSALTRTFNFLGAAVPRDLLQPGRTNPSGFWESARLRKLHDDLLASANTSWHDCLPLDPNWAKKVAERQCYRQQIKDCISQEFGGASLFVLKDPRICRFVPLILSILDELKIRAVAVLPIRNPLEVASSLAERNGFTQSKALLLWLRHVLEAEYYSRTLPRGFLNYEDLLAAGRRALSVPSGARASLGTLVGRTGSAIGQFLTGELRHHRVSAEQLKADPEVGFLDQGSYAIVANLAENGGDRSDFDRLDMIRSRFDEACAVMGPALRGEEALLAGTREQLSSLQGALDARTAENVALQRELQQLTGSVSQ